MKSTATLIALLLASVVAMPVAAGTVLGQTALNSARVDGALVPAGTTVLSPSTVETGAFPAAIHLTTGQTLNLSSNSSASLTTVPDGRISLTAESGTVEIGAESGEVFKLAANTVAMLDETEPGSGDAVVMITVCDDDDYLIEWDAADIDSCEDCYLPKKVQNDDGTWNYECKGKRAGFLFLGLSKGAAIGIGATGLVAGYAIAEDDCHDASPCVPCGSNPPGVGGGP